MKRLNVLMIGAGSVWQVKYRPALVRLLPRWAARGLAPSIWIAETKARTMDPLVSNWFDVTSQQGLACLRARLDEVDLAVVASWNSSHLSDVRLLDGHVPLVLVEKPLSDDPAEACSLTDLVRSWTPESACVAIDHYLWKPAVRTLLQMQRDGDLNVLVGQLRSVDISVREGRGIERGRERLLEGGLMQDLLIHAIDILAGVLGTDALRGFEILGVRRARYEGASTAEETSAGVELVGPNGLRSTLLIGKGQLDDKRIDIVGTTGTITADIASGAIVHAGPSGGVEALQGEMEDDAYDRLLSEAVDHVSKL